MMGSARANASRNAPARPGRTSRIATSRTGCSPCVFGIGRTDGERTTMSRMRSSGSCRALAGAHLPWPGRLRPAAGREQLPLVGGGGIEWRDVAAPRLEGPAEAIVRPLAVTRCDIDLPYVSGLLPPPRPFALGHECVG